MLLDFISYVKQDNLLIEPEFRRSWNEAYSTKEEDNACVWTWEMNGMFVH